jgi:prepilin-type N-terminal cleavage/methylation domain-containing protein
MYKNRNRQRGFTLIEIIVSLGIFSVVAVIAVGALVRITSANRQAQAIQGGVNNVSFVLDSMSRELRVASNIVCIRGVDLLAGNAGSPCDNTGTQSGGATGDDVKITFTSAIVDSSGVNLTYAYLIHRQSDSVATIYKAEETSAGQSINSGASSAQFYPVTADSVRITSYSVGTLGSVDYPYRWMFVRLQGYVGIKVKEQAVFDVQTSISQRVAN